MNVEKHQSLASASKISRVFSNVQCVISQLLKLINNSSSLNKGNPNREGGLDTRSYFSGPGCSKPD